MVDVYTPPSLDKKAFNCIYCHAYSAQSKWYLTGCEYTNGMGVQLGVRSGFRLSLCTHCGKTTVWHNDSIVFPLKSNVEPPNSDLPSEIQSDYEEASLICSLSPRGSAALLRLAIQKLCTHLGYSQRNINDAIKEMVINGLPVGVQQALDSLRVIGNEAVHPGEMDIKDDIKTVHKLFKLVNFIAHKMITEPREIEELYNGLPESKLQGIENRDSQ